MQALHIASDIIYLCESWSNNSCYLHWL